MNCRFCQHPLQKVFVDLGEQPSANCLVRSDQLNESEPRYPLKVFVCEECLLVQIPAILKADDIFTGNYVYFSSYAKSWVEHARRYVEMITERCQLGGDSFVVEIASNDGYLLQHFVAKNIPCLGIDPAANCAEAASKKGVETRVDFFTQGLAEKIAKEKGRADLILGNNVFAHVPELNDFVAGISSLLKPEGVLTLEFPHLARLIENNQFDTIYDEHFSYFSLKTARAVLAQHGLRVFDVEEWPTHGGSLRIFACHVDDASHQVEDAVEEMLNKEEAQRLSQISGYDDFQAKAETVKKDFLSLIEAEKSQGHRIAAFGAAAKGNTFLNFCGVGADTIDFVVDDTPAKQGLLLPGSHIPIVDEQRLRDEKPELIIILPWNFSAEIKERLSFTKEWEARLVTCIPSVIVS